jgi:flagellar hook-associated protein FlgK
MPESLLIGLTALQTHKRAMEVTSHNLANAATPGYSRQRAELVAPQPEDWNPGQLGRGVDVTAIRRIVDALTDERLRASATESGRLESLTTNLKTIELAFNEPGDNGLSGITNSLFGVFQDLANNPESSALRSAAVQELTTWTTTLNDLGTRLETLRADIRVAVDDQLTTVNSLAGEIADLNQAIRRERLLGNNPNDLLDRRDNLISELSGYLDLRVRIDPASMAASVDAGGVAIVSSGGANTLSTVLQTDGTLSIVTPTSGQLRPAGGSLAALDELDRTIIPGIIDQLDELAATMAQRLNQVHATGTSQAQLASGFEASFIIPTEALDANLDDVAVQATTTGGSGIPATFMPSFTDAAGNLIPRNLTINVRDTATGEARKYTIRYDPATENGTRSLSDLISAINTGSGGGFTVIPADGIGIPGIRAKAVAVDGGYQLQLLADINTSIDFSPALDLQPHLALWSGQSITVRATTAIPTSVGGKLQLEVEDDPAIAGAKRLRITGRSATDGTSQTYGVVALPSSGGPVTINVPGVGGSGVLQLDITAGAYRTGDRFAVALDAVGLVVSSGAVAGDYTIANQRSPTDASISIRGRYQGGLALNDASSGGYTQWSMRVVTAGTVGVSAPRLPGDPNPPVVEFSYYTGTPGNETLKTARITLDNTKPAGTPVEIADGVYAVFGDGDLAATAVGNDAVFTVDGLPDQAGLLPALGIGGLFTGSTAATLRVAERLSQDPSQLNVGTTRNEGDNSNLQGIIGARTEKLFNSGVFSLDDHYNAILSEVGVRIRQADRMSSNQDSIRASLENRRQQFSGVNIDEEVGLMIMQQQAYTAAARVITFARENIQTLLDLAR